MGRIRKSIRRPWTLGSIERPMAVSYGLVGAILVLGGVGYVLDRTLATGPWLLIAGLLAGLAVGFYSLGTLMSKG